MARHSLLFEMERDSGIPFRFIWAMWPTVCDRSGRFKWRPIELKPDIVPYDEGYDLSRVMDAFATRGMFVKYEHANEHYGVIPTFLTHQVVNNKEKSSSIPSHTHENSKIINVNEPLPTREVRDGDAWLVQLFLDQGELEGKGTGKELEREHGTGREGIFPNGKKTKIALLPEHRKLNAEIWETYNAAYKDRYKVDPVRNASVNSKISQLAARLGADSIPVVRFFLKHNDSQYLRGLHNIGLCLIHAEALYTQWKRNRAVTQADVKNFEKTSELQSQLTRIENGEI